MTADLEQMLGEFIAAFDVKLDTTVWDELIEEEISELYDAWSACDELAFIKESLDVIYVLVGNLVARGIHVDRAFTELHRSNMAKFAGGGRYRDDGKLLKPDGWVAPDMGQFVGGAK